uniref:Serine carboxypeptidase n=1 Tax=Meloidogyne hapla TaxID=6305 RepID=A0A1I8B1L3_MELHA
IVWFNGPGDEISQGCSPLEGLFSEIGPYLIDSNGTLNKNNYSWNKNASLLFIESPAGVGFSYAKNQNFKTGDNKTADLNYAFLKAFFNKYPKYKKNELYFAGISYAGYTAPLLARRVLDGNKGILLGNPILNIYLNKNMAAQFAYSHGFVDEKLWNDFKNNCCKGCVDPSNCDINFLRDECGYMTVGIVGVLGSKRVYRYDIYRDCPLDAEIQKPGSECRYIPERAYINNYMNLEQVQNALHALFANMTNGWSACTDLGNILYHMEYDDISPILKGLLNEKIRIMIYNGDTDSLNIFLTAQKIVENLGQKLTAAKQPWIFNGQIAGFKTEYGKLLTFTTIRGVGHMVGIKLII